MESKNSTPGFAEIVPLPGQMAVIQNITHADYSIGMHEILLSGSVGSTKSLLLAHLAIKHCWEYPRARVLAGRRSTPDLRLTIWNKMIEHLEGSLIEGFHYFLNNSRLEIKFRNGSEIICRSWADGMYQKLRSLELSAAIIEELSENTEDDKQAYDEIKMRIGRLPHIKENWLAAATNPDEPDGWIYKHFMLSQPHPTRHVFYSNTKENPYLPPQYIEQLERDLDPLMVRRMVYGEWLSIAGNNIYYAYSAENKRKQKYEINPQYPVILSWDFNIALEKPISMACMQYIGDVFHIFNEVVIDGARTADTIDELENKGILKKEWRYYICGDAAGKHKDTRAGRSDYDIIISEMQKRGLTFEFHVPPSNPSVRNRHNKVNAYCLNAKNERRLFVYEDAPTVDEGFRLTKLRPGANYIEDDSKRYQHISCAAGYAIMFETLMASRKPQETILL